jgi:hypothetical protein
VKLAIEPSRADALTAYFRRRVFPASTLNGELTRRSRLCSQAGPYRAGAEAGRAELEGHQLSGLPFQSLNFDKCQIALANGNIALLQIRVALPHCIFQLRQGFLQSHLSHLEFLP